MKFSELKVGEWFKLADGHLAELIFKKVKPEVGTGENFPFPTTMPFMGVYNSVADYGGRWVWGEDREVDPVDPGERSKFVEGLLSVFDECFCVNCFSTFKGFTGQRLCSEECERQWDRQSYGG